MAAEKPATEAAPKLSFTVSPTDITAWKQALSSPSDRPVLTHLNADTTWLLQLPYPGTSPSGPDGRRHFNILIDPWLQGPQSDVASWFSTQWHVVPPAVETMEQLNALLAQLEDPEAEGGEDEAAIEAAIRAQLENDQQDERKGERGSAIDAVVISHEFTDHCHQATLLELPKSTPVFATDKAAELIRSWSHFDHVVTMPAFPSDKPDLQSTLGHSLLPPWIGIGRVITPGNALYYHSAVLVAFSSPSSSSNSNSNSISLGHGTTEAVIYSPHGVKGADLSCVREAGIQTAALLHGLHDVRIWMTKQLNLGAINGLEAVRATRARYWVATHDEVKWGGGLISWFLRRTTYTLRDAVGSEEGRRRGEGSEGEEEDRDRYDFVELGSGEGMVLER